MIDIALRQKKAMIMLMNKSKAPYICQALNDEDWKTIEKFYPILKIFAAATKVFSGQTYATMYTVDEIYGELISMLIQEKTVVTKIMAEKIEEYQVELPPQHCLPRILHPGFKLNEQDVDFEEKRRLIEEHLEKYKNSTSIDEPTVVTTKRGLSAFQMFKEEIREHNKKRQPSFLVDLQARKEIDAYLSKPCTDSNVDELAWWASEGKAFPTLRAAARDWLAVPASSVPCEQMFSIAGNIVTKNRNQLAPKTTQALMSLKSWWVFSEILDSNDQIE